MLASFVSADRIRAGVRLTKGAARLWELLHRLAVDTAKARGYKATPNQITYHLPAVTVAGVLDYHPDHVARLGRELERVGLLDCGGHAQTVMGRNFYDGCLWAVKTRVEADAPRVRADEWKHNWRPDFAADVQAKTGAAAEMSGLKTEKAEPEEFYRAAKRRAAVPDGVKPPAVSSPDNSDPVGLRGVVEALAGLWQTHATKRAREVGRLARSLCDALKEPERRRYWCKVLWEALRSENEGRNGVQVLAAQVSRLAADLLEGAPWRSPGAVLAARLRAA